MTSSSQSTKNSKNGTISSNQTSERTDDLSGIIKIIAACRENGVTQFEGLGLKLVLDKPEATPPANMPVVAPEFSAEEIAQVREEEELRLKRDELDILRLADPYEYEQLMKKNELEIQDA